MATILLSRIPIFCALPPWHAPWEFDSQIPKAYGAALRFPVTQQSTRQPSFSAYRESGEFVTPLNLLRPGYLSAICGYGAEVERGARSRNGSIGGLTGMLRHPAADLMIPGAAGASFPRIGPRARPQSLRLSDTPGRDLRDST